MEIVILGAFCLSLLVCITADISIIWALLFGLVLFWCYGLKKGFSLTSLFKMSLAGISTVKNILITFMLIGVMTAMWRQSGTIAVIVSYASRLITPSVFLVAAFILCCFVSVLTGTAFGTAATMGVICATMGQAMEINTLLTGGAVLAGSYFGDRCSPISTSAILVSTLTKTDLFVNIKNMIKTAVVPFFMSCAIYLALGSVFAGKGSVPDLAGIFSREFEMKLVCVLPAALILLLSVLKVNVKIAMGAAIVCAVPICIFVQGWDIKEFFTLAVFGFESSDGAVAPMMNGGGIVSMVKAACIVCMSASYSDIFRKTGLLDKIKSSVYRLSQKTSSYFAAFCTSAVTGMIACNQTLTIMLTHQLCDGTESDKERFALNIEDSAVVMASLVPWSIASNVALSSVNCPQTSIAFAFFLYLLPICRLIGGGLRKKKK